MSEMSSHSLPKLCNCFLIHLLCLFLCLQTTTRTLDILVEISSWNNLPRQDMVHLDCRSRWIPPNEEGEYPVTYNWISTGNLIGKTRFSDGKPSSESHGTGQEKSLYSNDSCNLTGFGYGWDVLPSALTHWKGSIRKFVCCCNEQNLLFHVICHENKGSYSQ